VVRWSNNFWIRWDIDGQRYLVSRRVGYSAPSPWPPIRSTTRQTDYMIKRMVLGKRIKVRAVRKKRMGFF
jgi:hypothetical protein